MPPIGCPPRTRERLNLRPHKARPLSFLGSFPCSFTGRGAAQPPAQVVGPGRGGGGQQQPWKCASFTVPQQGLCSPPLAQALGPPRSPELKGNQVPSFFS